jgi:Inner membrane component of T3SS, cytoplasmic domain
VVCPNPKCGGENPPGESACQLCGTLLDASHGPSSPPLAREGAATKPRAPNVKRRTVYEPDADVASPTPNAIFGGLPLRAPIDPSNPFGGSSSAPQRVPPSLHLPTPEPAPPPQQRPKSRTIIDPGTGRNEVPRVEAALFAYSSSADPGTVHALRAGRNVIGRGDDCDIVLDDNRVSTQHAFLFVRPDDATFTDVSTNGSEVDGKPLIGESEKLTGTAMMRLGGTVLIFVRIPKDILKSVRS